MSESYHVTQPLPIEHTTPHCTCLGKRCSRCEIVRCIDYFHRFIRASDGLRSECKLCRKAEHETEEFKANRREKHRQNADHINQVKRERYRTYSEQEKARSATYRTNNPERVKAYQHAYSRSEAGRARDRRWNKTHPERVKAKYSRCWHKHLDAYHKRVRSYREKDPGWHRKYGRFNSAKRRTRKTGAGGSYTLAQWESLKLKYNYTCLCCGKREPEIKLTADHVIPIRRHGSSNIDNIQPLCKSCNSSKHTKTTDYRITWKGVDIVNE